VARGVPQGRAAADEWVRLRGLHVQVRRLHRHGEVYVKCAMYTSQRAQGTGHRGACSEFRAQGTGHRGECSGYRGVCSGHRAQGTG